MLKNKRKGFTLIELIITITILAIVSVPVGSLMITSIRSYTLNKQIQEDQYNIRMALLAMTRDLHDLTPGDIVETRAVIGNASNELRFSKSGKVYYYNIDSTSAVKTLQRMVVDSSGDVLSVDGTGIPFTQVPINTVQIELLHINAAGKWEAAPDSDRARFVRISLTSGPPEDEDRTRVSTTISISRIPPL